MDEPLKHALIEALKTLITSIVPSCAFVEKYGGVVVEGIAGNPKTQFCGIFAYQQHVSLELSYGARLDDPNRLLEGGGKNRRHLKLYALSHIDDKQCAGFLAQAAERQQADPTS